MRFNSFLISSSICCCPPGSCCLSNINVVVLSGAGNTKIVGSKDVISPTIIELFSESNPMLAICFAGGKLLIVTLKKKLRLCTYVSKSIYSIRVSIARYIFKMISKYSCMFSISNITSIHHKIKEYCIF